MADDNVVEIVYGKYSKFEVVQLSGGWFAKFYVRKDGRPHRGPYHDAETAIAAAEREARKEIASS